MLSGIDTTGTDEDLSRSPLPLVTTGPPDATATLYPPTLPVPSEATARNRLIIPKMKTPTANCCIVRSSGLNPPPRKIRSPRVVVKPELPPARRL